MVLAAAQTAIVAMMNSSSSKAKPEEWLHSWRLGVSVHVASCDDQGGEGADEADLVDGTAPVEESLALAVVRRGRLIAFHCLTNRIATPVRAALDLAGPLEGQDDLCLRRSLALAPFQLPAVRAPAFSAAN